MFEPIPSALRLDFKVIKTKLDNIIEYFINKIERDFPLKKLKHGRELFAGFVKISKNTYNSILYLCAEKPVNYYRKPEYVFSSLPLVRTILEQVFSMAYMSEDLENRIMLFHRAGWREMKIDYDKFLQRYASDSDQKAWLASLRKLVDEGIADLQITSAEAQDPKKIRRWPLPSEMARKTKSPTLKNLFQYLHDWFYKPLSQSVHLTWTGLSKAEVYLSLKESDDSMDEYISRVRSSSLFQSITLILALLSEINGTLNLDKSKDLKYLWTLIGEYFEEAKDLYALRYSTLLGRT